MSLVQFQRWLAEILLSNFRPRLFDGGVTVLAADGGSGERWIAGGRGLHISCWPRGQKEVIPGMRTMMATLRWADEPATDGERWWRKE